MRAQEGFLGDLLRLGGIAEHPERHAENAVLIRPDELFERAIVAGPEPIEKARGLGIIVSLHGKTITRGQSSRAFKCRPASQPGPPRHVVDSRLMTKREGMGAHHQSAAGM